MGHHRKHKSNHRHKKKHSKSKKNYKDAKRSSSSEEKRKRTVDSKRCSQGMEDTTHYDDSKPCSSRMNITCTKSAKLKHHKKKRSKSKNNYEDAKRSSSPEEKRGRTVDYKRRSQDMVDTTHYNVSKTCSSPMNATYTNTAKLQRHEKKHSKSKNNYEDAKGSSCPTERRYQRTFCGGVSALPAVDHRVPGPGFSGAPRNSSWISPRRLPSRLQHHPSSPITRRRTVDSERRLQDYNDSKNRWRPTNVTYTNTWKLEREKNEEPNSKLRYANVIEEFGDLFQAPKEYSLGHCVAEDLAMGSGIAVQFKRRFGRLNELYAQKPKEGGIVVLEDDSRYIYYLVTKIRSNSKPTYETLFKSLTKMLQHVKENNVRKVALPRIGCGLDRLEWDIVKFMLQYIFEGVNVEIKIYHFQVANITRENVKIPLQLGRRKSYLDWVDCVSNFFD